MEEARHWMWAKSKLESDSWEEEAFAEDAGGAHGGCVWPPRSYSCSFCRRDFRSAQALGGHMNVHRRDKARLKQSPNPNPASEVAFSSCTSFYPSDQTPTFLFNNPNPNPEFPDSGPRIIKVSSPPPPASAKVGNSDEKVSSTLGFFSPNYVQKSDKGSLVPPSRSSIILSEKRDHGEEKKDCVREDVSMRLNLVGPQSQRQTNEEVGSFKRRRIEEKPLSFFPTLRSAVERCLPQPEVLKLCSAASDDLDLELRLGDAPKVK